MFDIPDWSMLLMPSVSVIELIVRGALTFLALFVLLRITPQRQASGLSLTDLLVIVLIADAASPALIGTEAESIGDGLIVVVTVLVLNWSINALAYRVAWLGKFQYPDPVVLVRDGKYNRRAMRRELVTEDEMMTQFRQQGLESVDQVKSAQLEGDGNISVVPA